jgi:hypothetical protein
MMPRAVRPLLAACAAGWALACTVGCGAFWFGARYYPKTYVPLAFSERFYCPEDRVSVRARPDLPYRRFVCAGGDAGAPPDAGCEESPPPEVAGDPERLAVWRRVARPGAAIDDLATTTLEVSGCGERRFYACKRIMRKGQAGADCERGGLLDLGEKEPQPGGLGAAPPSREPP